MPPTITFIYVEDLLLRYPILTPKQREYEAAREYSRVFLTGISGELSHGEIYDGRVRDYDDWNTPNEAGRRGLNDDILLWNPVLETSFEVSLMSI